MNCRLKIRLPIFRPVFLSRKAQNTLSQAEQKVRLLLENNGEPDDQAFESDEEHI